MVETLMSIVKASPSWLQVSFEVIVVIFVAMMFVSIIAGLWMAGAILKRRSSYIAEVQAFPPKITFYQKDKSNATNEKQQ